MFPTSKPTVKSHLTGRSKLTEEVDPPTAAHVLAVYRILPKQYRLPLLVLDATGMRIGEFRRRPVA